MSSLPSYLVDLNPRSYLDEQAWLVLDFEVRNEEKGTALIRANYPVLSCFYFRGSLVTEDNPQCGVGPGTFKALAEALSKARIIVAQNAKYELQWLKRLGIATDHLLVLDTMVAEFVLAGNRRWPLDLDSLGRKYGCGGKDPVIDSLMRGGVCPSEQPLGRLKARVARDVETTREVARKQLQELDRLGLLPVFFTRCIATPVLAEMEMAGMTLDETRVKEAYEAAMRELAECEEELREVAGGRNLRSNNQMAELLYDVLKFEEMKDRRGNPLRNKPNKQQPDGARLTDTKTLEKLKATNKAQRRFVELRRRWGSVNAKITKNLEFFRHIVDERGGKFHGSFNQCITQTHRLSSNGRKVTFSDGFSGGAQFQNLPNELKPVFCASSPDHVLFEADGSGIEFRVAADLCKDQQAKLDIESGADIHRYTASEIFGKPEDKVTKEERRAAKADTFGPLFGKVSGTPGQIRYFEAFKKKYSGISKTQDSWVTKVLRHKELVTPWGMRFYWPHCRMDSRGYVEGRTQIMNYSIQSFATADIVPIALVYIYWRTKAAGLRAKLINTIHDSVICDIHKDDVPEYTEIAVTSFLDCVYHYLEKVYHYDFCHIPLGVGMQVARFWSEGEETKVSYPKSACEYIPC